MPGAPPGLTIRYQSCADVAAGGRHAPLGVARFGREAHAHATPWPEVPVLLDPLETPQLLEVWSTGRATGYAHFDGIACGFDGSVLFGGFSTNEMATGTLDAVTFDAYTRLFDVLDRSGYAHLWRVWNYFPRITAADGGMIRYHRFNLGRHQAFASRHRPIETAPAASALGTGGGPVVIYFLAGREPGLALENPRQVSAYHYPEQYGPRSPAFSRAIRVPVEQLLLVSGTASIVGHASTHDGNVTGQAAETLANLSALYARAGLPGPATARPRLKVYLRNPGHLPAVRHLVDPAGEAVYLAADICRSQLLIEVESVCEGQ